MTKKLFFVLLIPIVLITAACGTKTYTEKVSTEHELCVYDRTYDFWGNQKAEKVVVCTTRGN